MDILVVSPEETEDLAILPKVASFAVQFKLDLHK
jgi:hypothetical protein